MKPEKYSLMTMIVVVLCWSSFQTHAAPVKNNESVVAAPPDSQNPARTYLPESALNAPVFTPPAPVLPKPLPNIRIDSSITVGSVDSTTITLQRGAASNLPDLPPPAEPTPAQPYREPTAQELAEQASQLRRSLNLGATIYDHKVGEVNWTDQETGICYQALCGFDMGLLAGIGGFIHDGEEYSLMLMHTEIEGEEFQQLKHDGETIIPQIPAGVIRITAGDTGNASAIAPLYIIKDLITSEKERLTTYQAASKKYQRESAAWAAANPPVPQDEIIIFRPHRGSRYLTDPQPEKNGEPTR